MNRKSIAVAALLVAALAPLALATPTAFKDKVAVLVYDRDGETREVVLDPDLANALEIFANYRSGDEYEGPSERPCLRMALMTQGELFAEESSDPLSWDADRIRTRLLYFPPHAEAPALSQRVGEAPAGVLMSEATREIDARLRAVPAESHLQECSVRTSGPTLEEVAGVYGPATISERRSEDEYRTLANSLDPIELTLEPSGRLRATGTAGRGIDWLWPDGGFDGRWTFDQEKAIVTLAPEAPTFLGELQFEASGLMLYAQGERDGASIYVRFERR